MRKLGPNDCARCDGCGKIASGEEGAPWTAWTSMPLESAAAVIMGLVKPIVCPTCGGTGKAAPAPGGGAKDRA